MERKIPETPSLEFDLAVYILLKPSLIFNLNNLLVPDISRHMHHLDECKFKAEVYFFTAWNNKDPI